MSNIQRMHLNYTYYQIKITYRPSSGRVSIEYQKQIYSNVQSMSFGGV
jgi:hypothetical protein